jgi:hypothetical protein
MGAGRVRARRGSGSIRVRNGRLLAQVSLGADPGGRRVRRSRTFDSRPQAEAWIATQQLEHRQLANPVMDDRLDDYLRWWLAVEAPKRKPGRRPLARTTLATTGWSSSTTSSPSSGTARSVSSPSASSTRSRAASSPPAVPPATIDRMREALRSAHVHRRAAGAAGPQRRPLRRRGRRPPASGRSVHRSRAHAAARGRAGRALLPDPPAYHPARVCGSGRPAGCAGATSTWPRSRRGGRWCGSSTGGVSWSLPRPPPPDARSPTSTRPPTSCPTCTDGLTSRTHGGLPSDRP